MTVSTTQVRVSYTGDGTSTTFAVPFPFYLATDLKVFLAGSLITSGYSVTGGGSGTPLIPNTGSVVFATAPAAAVNVQIVLNVPLTQLVNLVDGTAFPSATLNQVNDRAIQAAQRLNDILSRTIRAPDGDVSPSMQLPTAASRAGFALMFDSNGNPTLGTPVTGTVTIDVLAPILELQRTAAEIAAGVTPVNYAYAPGPYIDPRRYGADSTGVADSTTAIQNAILVATQSGGWVVLPPGTYKVSSTITLRPNVVIWGAGPGDSSTIGSATRITQIVPTATFSGTDIIRADPADFGADVYCRGIGLSNFMIDMLNVKAASKRAINLRSVSDLPTFENLRVWNIDSGQALYVGVSANSGALLSDGLVFSNFVCNSNGIDVANTDPAVILEDCNEVSFRDGKILRRSNGAPAGGSIGINVRCTNIGCQGITFDGTSFAGFESSVKGSATDGGVGARWVRGINTTHESFKYGFYLDGTVSLPSSFWTLLGNRFISQLAGGSNVYADHATSNTIILDELSPAGSLVTLTANSGFNSIWAQPSQVTDSGTQNAVFGRASAGPTYSFNQITVNNGSAIKGFLVGTTSWTPSASLPSGSATSVSMSIPGAALGDLCIASFSVAVPGGAVLQANVGSAGNVVATLFNGSGGPLTLGAGTLKIAIIKT